MACIASQAAQTMPFTKGGATARSHWALKVPTWKAMAKDACSRSGTSNTARQCTTRARPPLNYVVGPRARDGRLDMHSYDDNALSIAAGMDVRLQRGWLLSLLLGMSRRAAPAVPAAWDRA